jgi:hypothetical protein
MFSENNINGETNRKYQSKILDPIGTLSDLITRVRIYSSTSNQKWGNGK